MIIIVMLTSFHHNVNFKKWTWGGWLAVLGNAVDSISLKMEWIQQVQSTCFESIFVSSNTEIMLWHYRLGHPSFQYLKYLFPKLFRNKVPSSFQCEICALEKQHRASYPPRPYKPSAPFSLIHSYVWGPSRDFIVSRKKMVCHIHWWSH